MSHRFFGPPDLPVRSILPDLSAALAANRPVVLQAPPGSGKTTLVPPALMDAPWLNGKRILMLEPRRLAARAAARRIAGLLGEDVGGRVGYHVRLERRVGAAARIEIVTEGLLIQRLLRDPELAEVGVVIFDEFHERSLATDQSLAMTLDVCRSIRPDLRLVVMSATLDPLPIAQHLGQAAVMTATARIWTVETRLQPRPASAPLPRQAADAIMLALDEEPGSLLVFLPGEREINRTAELLGHARLPPDVNVYPLYAALPRTLQDAAVEPAAPGRRKIVLATSIAESSLTIEGIRVVIDTGWMRVSRYSPRTGMSHLETLRVTRDRADQRRGRAGRLGPGVCYRLWDEAADRQMAPASMPEIMDADLTALVLQSAEWGADSRDRLPWFTPPPDAAWRQAAALLRALDAIDTQGRITPRGRLMVRLPVHPRLSHMILRASERGCGRLACLLAAAIVEQASEASLRRETDARRLLDRFGPDPVDAPSTPLDDDDADRKRPGALSWDARARRLAHQWGRHLPPRDNSKADIGRLLSWAFPDRIARRRDAPGRYLMVNGRGASLDAADRLAQEEWLVAAELQDDAADARIRLAAPVARQDVEADCAGQITDTPLLSWDRRVMAVQSVCRRHLGAIVLRDSGLRQPDPALLRSALLAGIRQQGLDRLNWTPGARSLQARVLFLRRVRPEDGWPDLSDRALLENLDAFLGHAIDGLARWEQVLNIDLSERLRAHPGMNRRLLDEFAPAQIPMPDGSRATIRYDQGETPVLAVRIQQAFGLKSTPRIAGGRVPLLMHLLSPARRPVQVTADLEGFWSGSYACARKELRGRYPRHAWPENPLTAQRESTAR